MNIFFLSRHTGDAETTASHIAKCYSDKHVVKIILEICQMLVTARRALGGPDNIPAGFEKPYKSAHPHHPMTLFCGSSSAAYNLVCNIGIALCTEYTHRYSKTHKCESYIKLLQEFPPSKWETTTVVKKGAKRRKVSSPTVYGRFGELRVPLCMPTEFHSEDGDAVAAYRAYYLSKKDINVWKTEKRDPPLWYTTAFSHN